VTDDKTGFVFIKPNVKEFVTAIRRALETYRNKEAWQKIQQNGMSENFSWNKSAQQYIELYKNLIANRT